MDGSLKLVGSSSTLLNVALKKTATASGEGSGEDASKAVDGSNSTKWSHLNGMSGEWLKVDLGAKYDICLHNCFKELSRPKQYPWILATSLLSSVSIKTAPAD